jgi:predicted HTH domain antitoxin
MNKAKSNQINLRVPSEVVEDLDVLAKQSHLTRIDVARQILLEGVEQRKRERALQLYRESRVSKSRAAELAGISLWQLMDTLEQTAVPAAYTLQEAVDDVRRLITSVMGASAKPI